jgi:hypothetical protein
MSKRVGRPPVVNMMVAVPLDIRAWLEDRSVLNLQPMTSVIIAAIRAQMDADQRQERALSETAA